MKPHISMLLGGLLVAATFSAQATLNSYTSSEANLVYSSVSDVTWTADANLLGTMMNQQGYDSLVTGILAVTSVVYDTPNSSDTPLRASQSKSKFATQGQSVTRDLEGQH